MFFFWNIELFLMFLFMSIVDDRIEFEVIIIMILDVVEGDIYLVGFGIEVDVVEVWVLYFNIIVNVFLGLLVNLFY